MQYFIVKTKQVRLYEKREETTKQAVHQLITRKSIIRGKKVVFNNMKSKHIMISDKLYIVQLLTVYN